jgi:hypothetical protein
MCRRCKKPNPESRQSAAAAGPDRNASGPASSTAAIRRPWNVSGAPVRARTCDVRAVHASDRRIRQMVSLLSPAFLSWKVATCAC